MGMVFGKIKVETPKFEVLQSSTDYEIRKYTNSVVAQVTYEASEFKGNPDGGFTVLANYIGVLGNPQNTKPEKIAMTTPVLTQSRLSQKITNDDEEKTKNTSVVVTMQFVLPSKYTKAEEAPTPIDERVVIKEVGERKYGVVRFSGVATAEVVKEKVEKLNKSLEKDGHKVIGEFLLARYNPPWLTLPYFRTNEVMIPID